MKHPLLLVGIAAMTLFSGGCAISDYEGHADHQTAAEAKLFATEAAQRVIDDAVQLFGGQGVVAGEPVERLYREIRALRIYEGTSEIQKIVIAGQLLPRAAADAAAAPSGGDR